MIARGMLLLLTFYVVPTAWSADVSKGSDLPSKAKESRQVAPANAASDPIADLFLGSDSPNQQTTQPVVQSVQPSVQPTYESWDVLRQYPRYTPLPPPSVNEAKEQEHPKETKENIDVKK